MHKRDFFFLYLIQATVVNATAEICVDSFKNSVQLAAINSSLDSQGFGVRVQTVFPSLDDSLVHGG